MNPYLNIILIYIIGVVVAAFMLRFNNSFYKKRHECDPPPLCLLSWFAVVVVILGFIVYIVELCLQHFNFSLEKVEKFLNCIMNYTDKE